ncbi:hypothetical protein KOW79_016648 [Hemibagrus wyckioides]|uniref:RRM domain-containing protein n=1 Tax=Hemibagrus wyckioides TaxID=337641 RepID=A0A9D3SDB7_9TELE|nr:hypothetical protein KOW79_016648 [Hemibagrus wyckioides]
MLAWRFSPAGQIHSIRLCRDRYTGSSLGCAYVNFWHRGDAERAIDMFHFELLLERPMQVMWSQWETTWRNQEVGKIILKNLDKSIDNLALYDTFSYCGRILSCKVVNNESGSNGCGYIQFETAEAAELVIERFNGKLLNGTQVHTHTHEILTLLSLLQNLNLYVKNLDCSVDDERLYAAFSQFGTIKSAKVMMENGRSRRFGFVCFESSEEAMIAIQEMNGRLLCGIPLYVGMAQRKEERQAYLTHLHNIPQNLDEPALVHQQTRSTERPSSSQVPCASDDCTKVSTPTSVDTAPVASVEQHPAVDSVPAVNEMDALLKAREAGYKPEVLKRTSNTKKKKRKNKKRNVKLIN